ncbi:MAG: aminotransferase class I/II-fold pyridoxal phosphate-dependent enzyme, partial [Nitrososphaerales archaeon]
MESLVANPESNVALLDRYRSGMDGTVVSVEDGFVSQVFPPRLQGSDFSFRDKYKTLNVYKFDRTFCDSTLRPFLNVYANSVDDNCYYEVVLGMLSSAPRHRIAGQVVAGSSWVEVDDPNDLATARFQFEPDERAAVLDRARGGHWNFDLLDFSFMRNAHFPTAGILSALRHALPELVQDYGSSQQVLNEKMSYFLRCRPDRLQVVHGASQLYPILGQLWAGCSTAIPRPTFGEYEKTFAISRVYRDAPGVGVEPDELQAAAEAADILVVVNPNNPTGTTMSTADLYDLARRRSGTTLLVDESFLLFSGQPSIVDLLERQPLDNVVVLTSLSKALGVPGLRLGFLYSANSNLVQDVGRALPIWNLSSPAECLLELLLKFRPDLERSIALTIEDRQRFRQRLMDSPIVDHVNGSGGTFLLVTLASADGRVAAEVRRELLARDSIEVKDVTGRFEDRRPRLRLGVRTASENDRLITA